LSLGVLGTMFQGAFHPNARGHRAIAAVIAPVIKRVQDGDLGGWHATGATLPDPRDVTLGGKPFASDPAARAEAIGYRRRTSCRWTRPTQHRNSPVCSATRSCASVPTTSNGHTLRRHSTVWHRSRSIRSSPDSKATRTSLRRSRARHPRQRQRQRPDRHAPAGQEPTPGQRRLPLGIRRTHRLTRRPRHHDRRKAAGDRDVAAQRNLFKGQHCQG
jgi:hypothetical protein